MSSAYSFIVQLLRNSVINNSDTIIENLKSLRSSFIKKATYHEEFILKHYSENGNVEKKYN